ncbi:hypothetical protein SIAM614_16377 [Stappia aggregata IAM 12614]|uniref:Uncharacterized protein n=1 Tax=Roseibium aggregatum (strain ATCC 25650 / DSM 13394 / JCM 20685 / NBRC 16684 / NCIMB 2208 / IAM 12614 / B1) TaxID=384765 RepID=A0NWM2_ROSAI|nr:hypothetical protein SIAM614_16377 [Stappia aggregata IAM 12614] [Roseibium aggregatum IAM 12614]
MFEQLAAEHASSPRVMATCPGAGTEQETPMEAKV